MVVGAVVVGGVLEPVVVVVVVGLAEVLDGAATGGSGAGRSNAKTTTATPASTSTIAPATRGRCAVSHAFTALTSTDRVASGGAC
ncbi:hypothetical protein GCM10027200_73110 [Lentzea nigeriaca]